MSSICKRCAEGVKHTHARCGNCHAVLGMRFVKDKTYPDEGNWYRTHPKGGKDKCDHLLKVRERDQRAVMTRTVFDPVVGQCVKVAW